MLLDTILHPTRIAYRKKKLNWIQKVFSFSVLKHLLYTRWLHRDYQQTADFVLDHPEYIGNSNNPVVERMIKSRVSNDCTVIDAEDGHRYNIEMEIIVKIRKLKPDYRWYHDLDEDDQSCANVMADLIRNKQMAQQKPVDGGTNEKENEERAQKEDLY